jgi:rubredoxin
VSQYRCPECGYVFDEAEGDVHEGYPPGTPFSELPDDFACPDCSVRFKDEFEETSRNSQS